MNESQARYGKTDRCHQMGDLVAEGLREAGEGAERE